MHEATKSPIAEEALRRIQALYVIEAEITGRPAAERQAERRARSKPLLAELKAWMEGQRRRASGKTVARQGAAICPGPLGGADPLRR